MTHPSEFPTSSSALTGLLPACATPFTWSILGPAAERALRRFYAELGHPLPAEPLAWRLTDGRPTLEGGLVDRADEALLSAWEEAAGSLKGRVLGSADRRLAAVVDGLLADVPERWAAVRRWQERVQAMQWRQATVLQIMEEIEPKAEATLWGQTALLAALALGRQIRSWLPPSADELAARLAAGLADGVGQAAYRCALWELEQTARQDGLDSERLAAAQAEFLGRYGGWAAEPLEATSPRWREAPQALRAYLAGRLAQPLGPAPLDPQEAARRRAAAASQAEEHVGMLRRRALAAAFERLQRLTELTAAAYEATVVVIETARNWAIGAAQEVVADGRLAAVEDVFLLELEELKQVMTGEWSSPELVQGVVEKRRAR
ncbi:MAG: hypothetical protein NZ528_03105 [Caldilineales bacterium]|nr:hypothetical protein [Caldilineales bacterium]